MQRLVLAAILMSAFSAQAFDQQSLMRTFFSVVLVRGYDDADGLAYGSGVVVAPNRVVTNCHVLRRTLKAWVSQAEDVYKVEAVHVDAHHDLCLLETENMPLKPVEIGSSLDLTKGSEVFALGHSSGSLTPLTSGGQIKSVYPFEGGDVVKTNARFTLGASGSPLFDGEGRLIGINTFKTPGHNAYFYAVPVEWLAALAAQPAETKLPVQGQAFWELPDQEKPFFMQVAMPRLNEDWNTLKTISERWTKAEPDNAEAWYELGSAEENLGHATAAETHYQHAAALNPGHTEALFRLGVFAAQRGDRDKMHHVSMTLTKFDSEMAEEFNKEVGCQTEC
jgi:serine protease Do